MSGLNWWLRDSWEMVVRNLIHIRRTPELLLDVTLSPIMFVLLFSFVFGGEPPEADEGAQEIVEFYVDDKDSVMAGAFLSAVAAIPLVFFANYLRTVFHGTRAAATIRRTTLVKSRRMPASTGMMTGTRIVSVAMTSSPHAVDALAYADTRLPAEELFRTVALVPQASEGGFQSVLGDRTLLLEQTERKLAELAEGEDDPARDPHRLLAAAGRALRRRPRHHGQAGDRALAPRADPRGHAGEHGADAQHGQLQARLAEPADDAADEEPSVVQREHGGVEPARPERRQSEDARAQITRKYGLQLADEAGLGGFSGSVFVGYHLRLLGMPSMLVKPSTVGSVPGICSVRNVRPNIIGVPRLPTLGWRTVAVTTVGRSHTPV